MIAIKLVLQSLAGVGAIVGCLGGSIFISTKTNFEETNDFYLVASNSRETNRKKELWVNSLDKNNASEQSKTKNYFCKNETNQQDESCELYSLDSHKTTKVIPLSKIRSFITKKPKSELKRTESIDELNPENFFLLKTKLNFFDYKNTSIEKFIQIEIKKEGNVVSDFSANLNILSKISATKIFGSPNILIAKAENNVEVTFSVSDKTNPYKCYFIKAESLKNKKTCFFQLIGKEPLNKKAESLSFEKFNIESQQENEKITPNSYYAILLSESNFLLSQLENKSQIWIEENKTSGAKKVQFLIKSGAFLTVNNVGIKNVFIF